MKVFRLNLIESLECGDHRQRRYNPADGIDLLLIQELYQLNWEHEAVVRHQIGRRTELQGRIQLFQAGVKIQRRLITEHSILVHFQNGRKLLDIINHRAVAGHYALRNSGGTGSKDDIQGIGVDRVLAHLLQQRRIRLRRADVAVEIDLSLTGKGSRLLRSKFVTDNCMRLQILKDQLDAVLRHLLIDRHIEAAGIYRSVEADNRVRMLTHEYDHRFLIMSLTLQESTDRLRIP